MSEIRKQLTIKTISEIFKLASRINIKPKDVLGVGGVNDVLLRIVLLVLPNS